MYVGAKNLKKDIEDRVHLVLAQAGEKWVNYLEQYSDEVEQLIKLTRNKRRFYQQGMRAATLIRSISIASLSPPQVGETCTHHQAMLKSVMHQKQAIADPLEQTATVWDLGDQPASYSGKEYSRLFKEIMEALT